MRDLFDRLRAGGEAAVEGLVDDGMHETVELEFKRKSDRSHGQYNDDDKKNLAKELSAFSNSMGGLLVWGRRRQYEKYNHRWWRRLVRHRRGRVWRPVLPTVNMHAQGGLAR